ncbi:hypothetical protein M3Y99_00474000 [Aphelenchoides fujianensis]|nr:hypothetical protein M3Y99_00474000 [Aphelenchoides fujianensis]
MFLLKKKKKTPELEEEEVDEASTLSEDEDLDNYECNCCGIKHKRLDDLIAKVGFLVHVVLMLSEFYRGRSSWWLNFGSALCYLALIYGIQLRKALLYVPYFVLNPLLVIFQVVHLLRSSYSGRDHNESLWSGFVNFCTLMVVVLFITALHVVCILIVMTRFQPFAEYVEKRKGGSVVEEEPPTTKREQPTIEFKSPPTASPQRPILKPTTSPAERKVSWSERTRTFFYPKADEEAADSTEIEAEIRPLRLDRPYHPASPSHPRSSSFV